MFHLFVYDFALTLFVVIYLICYTQKIDLGYND